MLHSAELPEGSTSSHAQDDAVNYSRDKAGEAILAQAGKASQGSWFTGRTVGESMYASWARASGLLKTCVESQK